MRSLSGAAADRATADALDRFWDSLGAGHPGGPGRPEELLDPALARSVRQFRLADDAPRPDPAFANRLRAELMTSQPVPAAAAPAPGPGVTGRLGRLPRHRVVVELMVAAALLLVILGGGSALNLPFALDPAVPTAAASGAAPGPAGVGLMAGPGCARTVTPEPTVAGTRTLPAPTSLPESRSGTVDAC